MSEHGKKTSKGAYGKYEVELESKAHRKKYLILIDLYILSNLKSAVPFQNVIAARDKIHIVKHLYGSTSLLKTLQCDPQGRH